MLITHLIVSGWILQAVGDEPAIRTEQRLRTDGRNTMSFPPHVQGYSK